jgi:Fe-S-cluster-containing dehydrogenase component/CRP-like cAMP-binding protein
MTTTATRTPALPARIWTARALRDVDARGRSELAPVSRVRVVAAGETLYRQGDPAEVVFVVIRGEIALEREGGERQRDVVRAEETFGAEPFVHPAARRSSTARARVASEVAMLPAQRMQRVVLRSQAPESALADPRMVRRVLADAVARVGRSLGDGAHASDGHLVDGLTSHRLAHGEPLRATGDAAALVLHGGLLEVGAGRHGTGSLVSLEAHRELVAVDHTWIALLSPAAYASLPRPDDGAVTRVVDPARIQASRSLLVLDGDACVRCGHCVASCASSHDDGVARLVRNGPALLHGAAFVLPGNCGHCAHPACLLDCPTEAITRDASGAVQIREDACTGCGRCVEACPWGNVRLSVSLQEKPVAVKCDLCRGEHALGGDGSPACVASCPVEALVRVDLHGDEQAEALDAAVEKALVVFARRSRRELGVLTGLVACSVAAACVASPRVCGELAATLFLLLGVHAAFKRSARAVARSYRAHLAFAAALVPLLGRHLAGVGARAAAPSALELVSLVAIASGACGALAYAFVPGRLGALGDDGTTPDELRREHARAGEQAFLLLTGRDERVKTWWRVRLSPYATSRFGALRLALSRRTAGSETARLQDEVKRTGQGRLPLETIEPLTRQAVRTRVLAARRLLHLLLRGWLPLHVAASILALALLVRHVVLHVLFH